VSRAGPGGAEKPFKAPGPELYMDVPESVIKEIAQLGGVLAKVYFDLYGKDKEKLKELAVGFAASFSKNPNIYYSIAQIEEPEEYGGYYSTYIEAVLGFKDFQALLHYVLAYSPVKVEILHPKEMTFKAEEVEALLQEVSDFIFKLKQKVDEVNPERKAVARQAAHMRAQMGRKLLGEGNAPEEA